MVVLMQLKLALIMETDMLDWVIKIQVYEQEREDKERGNEKDK